MSLMYKELTDKAYELHTNKKYNEAEMIYKKLLEFRPEDVNVLNLYGLLCITKSDITKAISLLTKALVLKKSSYIAANLAKAYYLNNETDKAITLYNQALSYEKTDDIYYSLAIAYKKKGNYAEVIKNYNLALELNPNNYKAMYNIARAYVDMNKIENAIMYGEMSLKLNEDESIYVFLSSCYEAANKYSLAANAIIKAAKYNPKNSSYYYNAGVLYSKDNNYQKAIESYNRAIALNRAYMEAYVNLAYIYKDKLKDNKTALKYLITAKTIDNNLKVNLALAQFYKDMNDNQMSLDVLEEIENSPDAYSIKSMNYMDMGEYEKALENIEKALSYDGNNPDYLHGKAVALKYLGKFDEALSILEELSKRSDCSTETKITLGMMYLQKKEFEKGMPLYILRSKNNNFSEIFKEKIWEKGMSLENKSVLVYSDCGLGDTIMFIRYAKMLSNIAKSIQVQTDKEILQLLRNSIENIKFISKTKKADEYDIVIPLMDLPYAIGCGFDSIPNKEGYLKSDEDLEKDIKELEILQTNKKKVGIFYRGNRNVFKNRAIDFNELIPILNDSHCQFYSFQIEKKLETHPNLINLYDYIGDYSDTAALLKEMDLLITIDSSIAHAAGALGIKTWLLLPKTAEWRWFDDENQCSWYDSVKIFKQSKNGDWAEPISRIMNEYEY